MKNCPVAPSGLPFDRDGNLIIPGSITTTSVTLRPSSTPNTKPDTLSVLANDPDVLLFTGNNGISQPISDTGASLLGWWWNTTKGWLGNLLSLYHIQLTGNQYIVKVYAGYPNRWREYTEQDRQQYNPDALPGVNYDMPETFIMVPTVIPGAAVNKQYFILNPVPTDSPNYLSTQSQTMYLVKTNDSITNETICWVWMWGVENQANFDLQNCYSRLSKLPTTPPIETYNSTFVDNNNPVNILTDYFKTLTLNMNPQMAVNIGATDYPGYPTMQNQLQKLLTTGVVYTSTVKNIWITRNPSALGPQIALSTTFITTGPANARAGGKLFVTGFIGVYNILNNTTTGWDIPLLADNMSGKTPGQVYSPSHVVIASEIYSVSGAVDSTGLPPYVPADHGVGQLEVRVAPINPASEYSDLIIAATDLEYTIGRNTHGNIVAYGPLNSPIRIASTFAEVQALLDSGVYRALVYTSRNTCMTRPTNNYWAYALGFYRLGYVNAKVPSNDPTGINALAPIFNNVIPLNNYFDTNETNTLYWRLDGPEIPGAPNTGPKLVERTGGYYKTPGSKFVFTTASIYEDGPDENIWSPYGDFVGALIFGLLDINKTGVPVGYVFLANMLGIDPTYSASLYKEFSPGLPVASLPNLDGWAEMFRYFKLKGVEGRIIMDLSLNLGGYGTPFTSLSSFFGANRPGFINDISWADSGYSGQIPISQMAAEMSLPGLDQYIAGFAEINCDLTAQLYPDLVFRSAGQKIVCITGLNSFSAGDIAPHNLRNNDQPMGDYGDLGYGTRSVLVGDLDARLISQASAQCTLFTNKNSRLTEDGYPASPFQVTGDAIATFKRAGSNSYTLSNQSAVVAPDLLLDSTISETWWLDTGYQGVYPLNPVDGGTDSNVLPLSTGVVQPDKTDPSTWRYRWLEAAILQLVEIPFLSAKKTTSVNSKYQRYLTSPLYIKHSKQRDIVNLRQMKQLQHNNS